MAPSESVSTDKKAEQIPEPAEPISANPGKKRASLYVWRSQAGHDARSEAVDFANTIF
jgi:hypothetical protein